MIREKKRGKKGKCPISLIFAKVKISYAYLLTCYINNIHVRRHIQSLVKHHGCRFLRKFLTAENLNYFRQELCL